MIALYLRVSVSERSAGTGSSESLVSQEAELRGFVASRDDLEGDVRVFADDGVSGRREDRSAMSALMGLAMEGLVSCVIVRDLSRLARNYVFAGRALFQLLPSLGVRVIAVEDGYDSLQSGNGVNERLLWGIVAS